MELTGSLIQWQEAGLSDLSAVLVDVTAGEAQFLADALEHIAAGENSGGRIDDGENLLHVYLVP